MCLFNDRQPVYRGRRRARFGTHRNKRARLRLAVKRLISLVVVRSPDRNTSLTAGLPLKERGNRKLTTFCLLETFGQPRERVRRPAHNKALAAGRLSVMMEGPTLARSAQS